MGMSENAPVQPFAALAPPHVPRLLCLHVRNRTICIRSYTWLSVQATAKHLTLLVPSIFTARLTSALYSRVQGALAAMYPDLAARSSPSAAGA